MKAEHENSQEALPLRDGRKLNQKKVRLILDAARSCFLEHGYDRTSMDIVAQDAGVSKATVYAYFESKEALLFELVEEEFTCAGPGPLWDRSQPLMDVEDSLRSIARKFTSLFLNDKALAFHRLITANASRFPEIGKIFMKSGPRKHQAEVSDFLRRACDEGLLAIADIELAGRQFLSLVQGDLPLSWALSMEPPKDAKLNTLIEGGVRVFLAAYGRDVRRPTVTTDNHLPPPAQ